MDNEEMQARHLVELGFLQDAAGELGYSSRIANRSATVPYHTLVVELGPDGRGRPRQLALNFYPIDDPEFADSLFLQYFIAFPFAVKNEAKAALAATLHLVNSKVVLGHFGLSGEDEQVHFRYVQVVESDDVISTETVANVLTLVSHTPTLFETLIEDVATGKKPLAAARAEVESIYAEPS